MGSADEQDLARLYSRNKSENKRCWEIKRNDVFGRYVVATRDIAPGEVIFTEHPLEVGPNHINEVLCCVACHRHLSLPSGCPSCDLPLCPGCPLRHKHQSRECPLFENSRLNFAFRNEEGEYELSNIPYDAILVLRLLLMKEKRPDDWRTFRLLQCSLDEWRKMHPWEENQEEKVEIIREKLKQSKFSREDILEVIAICCTNTFSKYLDPNSEGEAGPGLVGTKMRAIFPMTSMLSHSCHPNVEQTIGDHSGGLVLDMVTVRPVAAGEQIYISYTELLAPTLVRQHTLLTNKLFLCQCDRCCDPTELDSYGSGIKCTSCLRRGEAAPGTLLTIPGDVDTWRCDLGSCGATVPASTVQRLVFRLWDQVEAAVDSPEAGVRELEAALAKFSRVLHPGHAGLARIKYSLCGLYGRSPGHELFKLNEKQLHRKRTLCEEMLTYLDLVQPGFSCRRGMILYELHTALLIQGRGALASDKAGARQLLRRSLQSLRQCLAVLGLQASSTFPGQLHAAVSASRGQVEDFIKTSIKQ